MPNERDSYSALEYRDLSVGENELRVGVDAGGDVVFVLDLAINETKPNVLLVIDSDDGRKWDDVLVNDYHVNLEDVRPKKDNKYQKLDIEYGGLDVYRDLIAAHDAGDDVAECLKRLAIFRNAAVQRAAKERLATAEVVADNARETIEKTNESIDELNERVRGLRAKVVELRKNVGKEPTKQSAAKILRAESQIDAINEKIKRAKKRVENAQKRLAVAADDADVARDILARVADVADNANVPATVRVAPVALKSDDNNTNIIIDNQKAEIMADEEVKPLFDTDPEILDEEIAFKPIEFSVPVVDTPAPTPAPVEPALPEAAPVMPADDGAPVVPLVFDAPVATEGYTQETDVLLPSQMENPAPAPVLDSITSVETPTDDVPDVVVPAYAREMKSDVTSDVAPAPVDSGMRPVSPISGVAPVVAANDAPKRKQNFVYYALLVALIMLSIFVLWFYQKTTGGGALPNIGDKVAPEIVETVASVEKTETPVEKIEPVAPVEQPEPVLEPQPVPPVEQPESVPSPQPEPPVEQSEPVLEPQPEPSVEQLVVDEPDEIVIPVPVSVLKTVPDAPEPAVVKVVETEEEVLAKKPAYGVSQNDAMFMADDNFETDRLSPDVAEQDFVMVDMYDTPIVSAPQPEYVDETGACENGAAPDKFGCCPGETYTQIDNGGFVCCPDIGGDCFPPLF